MAGVTPMTGGQKFKLEIYRLLSKDNSAAEEALAFISADQPKLESFKLRYNDGDANPDFASRTIEVVHKPKEALDLSTTGVRYEPCNQLG